MGTAILIVESDARLRGRVHDFLVSKGVEVREADSGAAALMSIQQMLPDVVVLADDLPDQAGIDVLRAIRFDHAELPVVLAASAVPRGGLEALFEAGCGGFLNKPYELSELVARVRPLLRRTRAKEPPEPAPRAPTTLEAKVLVVDDNADNRNVLTRRLQRRRYEVVEAVDGSDALTVLDQDSFDLVLLDVMMPKVGGLQVLEIIRQTRDLAALPVIMATAKDRSEDIVAALQLGANDYVTKPIDFKVLMARISTQLTMKKAVAEARNNELRYRMLAENSPDLVSRHDLAGAFLYASPACREILGTWPAELITRPIQDLCHPRDKPELQARWAALCKSEGTSTLVFRAQHKDGRWFWMETRTRTLKSPLAAGQADIQATSRDITALVEGLKQKLG